MKTLLIALSILSLAACSTTGSLITDAPNAWVNVNTDGAKRVVWCEAKNKSGNTEPKCYEPEFMIFRK